MSFIQPDFPQDPLDLIISEKNKRLAEELLLNGMELEKINGILRQFFSFKVVLREIYNHANNPEWLETLAWVRIVDKQYKKAIRSLEILLSDESIPSGTRKTIIKKDIEKLKDNRDFLTYTTMTKPLMTPVPTSINQMIVFQAFALFKYLKKFKGKKQSEYRQDHNLEGVEMSKKASEKPLLDNEIYNFIAEIFRNLYKNTALDSNMKNITGDILKRNFIDNADKLTPEKYNELEIILNRFTSKTS